MLVGAAPPFAFLDPPGSPLMRFIHLPSTAWLGCALVAAAAPAEAWNKRSCLNKDDPRQFIDAIAASIREENDSFEKVKTYENILSCYNSAAEQERECLKRTAHYARVWQRSSANGLGLQQSDGSVWPNDKFYEANEKALAVPECLKNADLFTQLQKTNLSDINSVKTTVDAINRQCQNAIVVPYVTATVNSIDQNDVGSDWRGRIVMWTEDTDFSQYVQFSVNANKATKQPKRVQASVVKIKKSDNDKGNTYIFDWARVVPNQFVPKLAGQQFGNDQHCYSCHWNGVLAIYPFQPQPPEKEKEIDVGNAASKLGDGYKEWLKQLNDAYLSEAIRINKKILADRINFTKVVGAPPQLSELPDVLSDPTCVDADLDGNNVSAQDQQTAIDKLSAKGCSKCHASRSKGFYEPGGYFAMIQKYVSGGLMPPKELTADSIAKGQTKADRSDIHGFGRLANQCFVDSAYWNFNAWLKSDCN
jgi:hypothetical protein